MSTIAILDRRSIKEHLKLALPLSAAAMGQHFMTVVDIAMAGHHSDAALAGAGIGSSYVFVIQIVCAGILLGLDAYIPKAIGERNQRKIWNYFLAGKRIALYLTLPAALLVILAPFWMHFFISDQAIIANVNSYTLSRVFGLFPYLYFIVQRSFLQAHEKTKPIVIAIILANIFNFFLDAILIHGDKALQWIGAPAIGLPSFGALGAGIATSIVSWIACFYLLRHIRPPRIDYNEYRHSINDILKTGFPIAGQLLVECGFFSLTGFITGILGQIAAGAHQIALAIAALSFSGALGMASATAVRVGRRIGEGNFESAKNVGYLGVIIGVVFMCFAGMIFIVMPETLTGFFSDSKDILTLANTLLFVAVFFQLSDAIQVITAGALRGAGITKPAFYANLIGHYAVGLPLGLWLTFEKSYGAVGLWWGLTGGLVVVSILLLWCFHRLKK